MDNIEKLKAEADEIKKSLNALKDNVSISEDEKKNQAESLKNQAEIVEQKVKDEINVLNGKTDAESKKKKEEAEALLDSFTDIMNLYTSIINSSNNTSTQTKQAETENKNIFSRVGEWIWDQWSKAGNWVWEQRNSIWDTKKRKGEWRKNWFRLAWFALTGIWGAALICKWAKKMRDWTFWGDKEDDSTVENDNSSEEKQDEDKGEKESLLERWFDVLLRFLDKKSKE